MYNKDTNTDKYYYNQNGEYVPVFNTYLSDYIEVNSNSNYTLTTTTGSSNRRINYFNKNKEWIGQDVTSLNNYNIQTPLNTKYIRVSFYIGILATETQIEVGSTSTTYEPYTAQTQLLSLGNIELCKIGDYQDYIYKNSDKWYKHTNIEKILSYAGETITTSYVSTTGELSTGATVYYVLSTAIEEEITDTTLISQLDALYDLQTYKNVTNIFTTTTNENPIIDVTYRKDIETIYPQSLDIKNIVKCTQQEYDDMTSHDSTTLYLIEEEE